MNNPTALPCSLGSGIADARRSWFALALLLLLGAAGGCSFHVERPRLAVRRVEWLGADDRGASLRVVLAAYNPNGFELPLRDLRASLAIERQDTGSSVTNLNAVLPPQREVEVTADVFVPWRGVPGALLTAAMHPVISYQVDGTITAERYVAVNTRFTHQGTIDRDALLGRAAHSLHEVVSGLRHHWHSSGSPDNAAAPPADAAVPAEGTAAP